MGEIKSTNMRIDLDDLEAFRAFCEENKLTQAKGFGHLIDVLELERAKAEVPGRATEIEEFESHVQFILRAFTQSVALAENTEARVRDEFARRLESKDETIANLQGDIKAAKAKLAEYAGMEAQFLALQMELAQAQTDIRTLEDSKGYLEEQCSKREADKQRIVDMLTEKLAVAEQKAAGYDDLRAERDGLASDLQKAMADAKEQARNYEMQAERFAREAEKAQVVAVAEEKAQAAAMEATLRGELQAVKVKAAEDLRAAEERAHEADKANAAEIRSLEKALAAAQQELAVLKSKTEESK